MSRNFNWEPLNDRTMDRRQQQQIDGHSIMENATNSIQRSNQIAIETEQIGTEVLSELGEQRESLLRSTRRLEDANEDLAKSRVIIRRLRREVLYNKIVLILIIIFEVSILVGILLVKYLKVK